MSNQITTAFIEKYKADVTLLLQQSESKFESTVRVESQDAETEYYDQIGPVSAQEWGPRHGDTPLMETPHERRAVKIRPYIWADLIDKPDRVRIAMSPDSAYTKNGVAAFKRRKDDVILASMVNSARVGEEGETLLALPESSYMRETGTGVLTVNKLIAIREWFWNNEVEEDEEIHMAISPNSISKLLEDPKVTSADYNTVKALVKGDIDSFMGFKFHRTLRLPHRQRTQGTPSNGYIRSNHVWVKSGVLMTKGQDIQVSVDKRPDKKNSTQIMITMDIGGTRMEEKKVLVFETFEGTTPPVPAP